jgi:hypothetical protein
VAFVGGLEAFHLGLRLGARFLQINYQINYCQIRRMNV